MLTSYTDIAPVDGAATLEPGTVSAPAAVGGGGNNMPPAPPTGADAPGDILYGAKAIARHLFGADGRREQRRVFNLWSHYQYRKERVGFFKLKGAVCLSKSQWRKFQGR